MDGLGFHPGGLGQALGCTAGRGAQGHFDGLGHERPQDGVDQRRLAHARAAGDHQHLARQGQPERLPLAVGHGDAGPRLEPGNRLVNVDLRPGRPTGGQGAEPLGNGLLGPVEPGQEDAAPVTDGVSHHGAVLQFKFQRGRDPRGWHLDQRGRELDELVLRQSAVTLVHGFGQPVGHARPDADHGVLVDADLHGDLVGGLEADAAYIPREPVGVVADDLHGLGAVSLVDPHRTRGADPIGVQEQHDLAHDLLLGPARDDAPGALGTDAVDLTQTRGLLLDDVEHGVAELAGEPLGVGRADAADHARREVLLDALERRGWARLQEGGPELHPVLAVDRPGARRNHELSSRNQGGVAHHGDEVALPARLDAQHAEAVVGVVERDPLHEPGQVLRAWLLITGGESRHPSTVA